MVNDFGCGYAVNQRAMMLSQKSPDVRPVKIGANANLERAWQQYQEAKTEQVAATHQVKQHCVHFCRKPTSLVLMFALGSLTATVLERSPALVAVPAQALTNITRLAIAVAKFRQAQDVQVENKN